MVLPQQGVRRGPREIVRNRDRASRMRRELLPLYISPSTLCVKGTVSLHQGRGEGLLSTHDIGRVESNHLWENLLHQVVQSLHMGDAIGSIKACGPATRHSPKK